jgi:phosphoribosylaminoimidazole-succinocarboxamide synthase
VDAALWERTCHAARSIFARGQAVAESAGLILADTKFEFGTDADDQLVLIDEVLTPDSSRYWVADTYEARLAAGEEPESLDKEVVRRALIDAGYAGDGAPPALADDVWEATSSRYIDAYERITATPFRPGAYPVAERLQRWYRNAC